MVCPKCSDRTGGRRPRGEGKWKRVKYPFVKFLGIYIPLPGSRLRQVCSTCGYLDDRDGWIGSGTDKVYLGPDDSKIGVLGDEDYWAEEFYKKKQMPCCHRPMSFYEGPSGGMSTNIKCGYDDCEAKWNMTPMIEKIERIGGQTKGEIESAIVEKTFEQ